jgi:hypothetical protein
MNMTLYDLAEGYQNVLALIDEESPDTDVLNALTTIEGAIEVKAGNIANLIKSLEAEAEVIKTEEKRLAQRRKSRENAADYVKQYLKVSMEQMGMDKIKTPTRTISIQNNPPSLLITDKDIIPQKYLTLIPEHFEVRNDAVKDDLKAGVDVPGAELKTGRGLRIR